MIAILLALLIRGIRSTSGEITGLMDNKCVEVIRFFANFHNTFYNTIYLALPVNNKAFIKVV